MRAAAPSGRDNRLLLHLAPRARRALVAAGEPVELVFGQVLAEPDALVREVYFPLAGFISLMVPAEAGASLEVGLIGAEGMLGATLALGVRAAPFHSLVQGAGVALRLPATAFVASIAAAPAFASALTRYCYVLLRQAAQMTACTRYHTVEQRLARWLLMSDDRAGGGTIHLTHDFLARMLGVRRVGVTLAAGALHRQGLIAYRRGEVAVLRRRGLARAACSCYARDQRLYEATLGVGRVR